MYISDAVIKRLPTYLRYLDSLLSKGIYRISSDDLGKIMGLTPSQVRQDINTFGGMGRQGYGYPIIELKKHIEEIIGINKSQSIIVIGAGNIGTSLAGYNGFGNFGFKVVAVFDSDKDKIGKELNNLTIKSIDELKKFISQNNIKYAAITCPATVAQNVVDLSYEAGVKAFWNFSPIDLKLKDDAVSVNVSLSESLQQLSFRLNKLNNKKK